jgi:hypothetical protein
VRQGRPGEAILGVTRRHESGQARRPGELLGAQGKARQAFLVLIGEAGRGRRGTAEVAWTGETRPTRRDWLGRSGPARTSWIDRAWRHTGGADLARQVSQGWESQGRQRVARPGKSGHGRHGGHDSALAGQGKTGPAGRGCLGQDTAWRGSQRPAGRGEASASPGCPRWGKARNGEAGMVRVGAAWSGQARQRLAGMTRSDQAGQLRIGQGVARPARQGGPGHIASWLGVAGAAWHFRVGAVWFGLDRQA